MSKEQNHVKDAIKVYLDERAKNDEQFAQCYAKANKNIDECFDYVIGEACKRGNSRLRAEPSVCLGRERLLELGAEGCGSVR